MLVIHHSISFTPHPDSRNYILARCTCGWRYPADGSMGPSIEVQSRAACHDLDIMPGMFANEEASCSK